MSARKTNLPAFVIRPNSRPAGGARVAYAAVPAGALRVSVRWVNRKAVRWVPHLLFPHVVP